MKKTATTKKEGEKNAEYIFTLKIENETYIGEGATGFEALKAIPVPELISTGSLTVEHQGKSKEMLFSGHQLKRLFNIHHQELLINDLLLGLD